MKNWLDLVVDANSIRAIFGSDVPSLDLIDLHEVTLHRDGPRVLLRFDLQQFPKQPPKKWMTSNFNCVQLKLLAVGIHELTISGLESKSLLNLSIIENGDLIRLHADGDGMRLNLLIDNLFIDSISAYCDKHA